jgi:hypothetical protein
VWAVGSRKLEKGMNESEWIKETDAVGREKWWEEHKPENDGLALKIFSEMCCSECKCKNE